MKREKEQIEIRYLLKVGDKYVKQTDEIEFFYELPDEDDYRDKQDYFDAVRSQLLVEKSDAGVFGNRERGWLPKYTIGEHLYWSDRGKRPDTIEEVAQHFKLYLGDVDIQIVCSTTSILTREILQVEKII